MPSFHHLQVKDIRRETTDCVSIAFHIPEALATNFQFTQGQYLTLRTTIKGEDIRRSYSICTSPKEADLRVAIKQVPNGRFSTYANQQLQVGATLQVMPPMGNFYTQLAPDNAHHYVAFAAGSGITPIMSILKTVLEVEPQSRFTLFFGNKTTDSILFREELEALKNIHLERLSIHHILSRESTGSMLFDGRITQEKCERFTNLLFDPTAVDAYFLCGPEAMILDVQDALLQTGVDKKKIHFELFTTPGQAKQQRAISKKEVVKDAAITIQLDGASYSFPMTSAETTLLDAALEGGLDLPFACKGGVCCTCRAKVIEGAASMDVNYALEPDEVAAGYILTCQAHPTTPKVAIDFDS